MATRTILTLLLFATPPALAQDDEAAELPALAGPRVEEPADEGAQAFMPDEQRLIQRKALEARALPRLLGQMSGRRAEASIRLSPTQQRALTAIRRDFETKITSYLDKHRERIAADLRQLGAERAADKLGGDGEFAARELLELLERVPRDLLSRAAAEQGLDDADRRALFRSLDEDQREALLRLVAIQREAPNAREIHDKALAELNDAQRAHVEQEFARLHETQNREIRMAQEMRGDEMMAPPEDRDMAMRSAQPAGPDRLDRLIAELLPEERELLADLIERRLMMERRQRPGRDKQPPSMDEIEVPPPAPSR